MRERRRNGFFSPLIVDPSDRQEKLTYEKTKKEEELVHQALLENELLKNIVSEQSVQQIVDCMYVDKFKPDDTLIEEGKINSLLYVTVDGCFDLLEKSIRVETFKNVRVVGEIALIHSSEATCTVKAASKCTIWVLNCLYYRSLIARSRIEKRDELIEYLRDVPSLSKATDEKLYCLTDILEDNFFAGKTLISREGDTVESFILVTSGSATILSRNSNKKLDKLTKGCFYGEHIFSKESKSVYTIIADPPGVRCLVLSRTYFLQHYRDLDDFLNRKTYTDFSGDKRYDSVELKNLKKIKTLGVGGFGRVELVQDTKHKDDIFALKKMKKSEINGKSQIEQAYNEKELQILCRSNFVVRLYRTFRDSKYVYFLLEPCLGGDLWNLLRRQRTKRFETNTAKFYAGCILEALDYLHSKDIVFRDLKPENIMVCSNGYLKLTDFGFAKRIGLNQFSNTFVGTAEYIAPELLQNAPHDKGVDYWALGIFIYEMLVGKSPFRNDQHNDMKTYEAILRGIDFATFPALLISPRARNLIKKLCNARSVNRLGCLHNGVNDIRIHPWFSRLDWEKLRRFELEPPIRISLNGRTDTRYFDQFDDDQEDVKDDFSAWANNF